MQHFKSLVSLLTNIKLKVRLGRFRTEDKVVEEAGLTVPIPSTFQVEHSAVVRGKDSLCDQLLENVR